ncbi:MAG: hypothetical protein IK093_18350 [Ruminiclostridium sp.]|nr:hypothetical protein [Ruminiclostridium sp.]
MKINKILAAGVAATLAVTSLSAVVSAETVTKSFDMGTSVATYKLNTTENWKSVDFLAAVDPLTGATIPSAAIVEPLVDGDKLVYDFSEAYFDTWGGTVKKTSVKVNSVKLKVTGIQGAKNNSSKEYTYEFKNVDNKNIKFELTMNKSVGKGFIPTQFVEITKAEVVIDFQFDSTNETLFKNAKNSNSSSAEWGGGLQNIKVTTVKTAAADLDALKKAANEAQAKWDAAEAAYDKAKADYDKAVKENEGKTKDAQEAYDAAVKNLTEVNSQAQIYLANQTTGIPDLLTQSYKDAADLRMDDIYAYTIEQGIVVKENEQQQPPEGEQWTTLDKILADAKKEQAEEEKKATTAAANKQAAEALYAVAQQAIEAVGGSAVLNEEDPGLSVVNFPAALEIPEETQAQLKNNYLQAASQKVAYTNAEAMATARVALIKAIVEDIEEDIKEFDKLVETERTALVKPYTDAKDAAKKALDGIGTVDDTALKAAEKAADDAETDYEIALAVYLSALEAGGDNIINVINGLVPGYYENASFGDITSEIRYAPLYKTTNNTTIGRKDVWALSITNDHYSDSYSTGSWYDDEANQSYNNDDVHDGTVKRAFAGLASQAADFFNKQDNGKIIFKFANPASTSSTWVNGGIPSTEVGLKSAIAGTNFGMFWNYDLSTGQLVALGQVDSDALTVTFDVSQILDDMGGLTKGNLADIYYGMNSGKTYGTPYNFTGYLVEKVTFEYDDAESETDAETETVDDTDDDTETVDDEDDDYEEEDDDDDYVEDEDDDDDYFIDDEDDDDDDAYIEDEDDDDDTAAVVVEDDSDDTDTNNDVVIVTPVKEDDDANPGTGVGLAVIPAIVAAAAMAISKKRK